MGLPTTGGFQLRDYQRDMMTVTRSLYDEGVNRQLSVAATGLGKTVFFSNLTKFFPELAKYGMLVIAHRDELVMQAADKIKRSNPTLSVGIEKGDYRSMREVDVLVTSVQTLGRKGSKRINKFPSFGIIVTDEAHHVSAGSQYDRLLTHYGVGTDVMMRPLPDGSRPLSVGVTATPNRHDNKGLNLFYDEIAVNYDIRFGVKNGWLVDIEAYSIDTETNLGDLKTKMGDFDQKGLASLVNVDERNQVVVSAFRQHGGKKGICFTVNVAHAHDLAEAFTAMGIKAVAVDGKTPMEERRQAIKDFRFGDVDVLCNCGVFTEGFDAPEADTIIMARPTKSAPLYTQMLGRGTRPAVDVNYDTREERLAAIKMSHKPCMIVIDFVDNTGKHSLITAPTLFGLKPKFKADAGSRMISEVVERIEELERQNPGKKVREGESLEEVETIARKVSIWDAAMGSDALRSASQFRWLENGEGFQIEVPHPESRFYISIQPDTLDRWKISKITPPHFDPTLGFKVRSKEVHGDKEFGSWEEAVQACDRQINNRFPDLKQIMRHSPNWGKKAATDKQLNLLRKMRVPHEGDISKGQASSLISFALQRKNSGVHA